MRTATGEFNDVLTTHRDFMYKKEEKDVIKNTFAEYGVECNDITNWNHSYKVQTRGETGAMTEPMNIEDAIETIKKKTKGASEKAIDASKLRKAPFFYDKEITKVKEIPSSPTRYALNYGYLDRACWSKFKSNQVAVHATHFEILPHSNNDQEEMQYISEIVNSDHIPHFHVFDIIPRTEFPQFRDLLAK